METVNIPDDNLGLERMAYTTFYNAHNVRRVSQAPTKIDTWSTMTLPIKSVLHTISGFDTLVATDGMPDPLIPVVTNERLPVFLMIKTTVATESSLPLGVKENYIYRRNTLMAGISNFYTHHKQFRRILSERTLNSLSGVLTWVDYSPLNEIHVNGALSAYRKFDIMFRTLIDSVVDIGPGRDHYIVLPQGNGVFSKPLLTRAFKELTVGSLSNFAHDPSIYPIIHLLGYVAGYTTKFPVTPYKEDVAIYGKDSPGLGPMRSTSMIERIPEHMLPRINFILQKGDQATVYNLADINKFAQDPSFFNKFYRHIMRLRVDGAVIPEHIETDSEQFDTLVTSLSGDRVESDKGSVEISATNGALSVKNDKVVVTPSETPGAERGASVKITPQHEIEVPELADSQALKGKSLEQKVRESVATRAQTPGNDEPKIVSKRQQLLETHFNTTLGGKPLGELIQAPSDIAVKPRTLDFLTNVSEESYKSSSLIAIDRAYQTHGYKHELAKVIGSLGKHGLFVTKIDEEFQRTEMDRTVTYKVALTDEQGKSHRIQFTVPEIDESGLMTLSGTSYRLTRQIANIPICKVSPTRVNLASYYNKIIVERVRTKRNSYEQSIFALIEMLRANGELAAVAGSAPAPTQSVPYDYSAIGSNFTEITVKEFKFSFDGNHGSLDLLPFNNAERKARLEKTYGIFVGIGPDGSCLYWDRTNQIHYVDSNDTLVMSWASFNQFLVYHLGEIAAPRKTVNEWTEANVLDRTIPLVFILAYRFGLKSIFGKINLAYKFYPTGTKASIDLDDIAVKFSDGTLVFNRYPISKSLIAAGLNWVNLKTIAFRDMELPGTYADILALKDLTVGVLKGIDGFYDFFVDPITETILEGMGEPITFHELLLRANILLTDYSALESSAIANHRFRLHERFNGMVYNEIFRALARYRNNPTARSGFSINPEAVLLKIIKDPTISPNDVINPVHELKQRANFTYGGSSGRVGDRFSPQERAFPKDGLGVISESVPDSSKVGVTSYLSSSPRIQNIHGVPMPHDGSEKLTAPEILSVGSMVMPGGTGDDGKRANYLTIQISHYVPNHHEGETLAVRTGYDSVLPHLSSDTFSSAAAEDGIVESIDEKNKVLKVRYKEQVIPTLRTLKVPYLENYINNSRDNGTTLGFLIPESEIGDFPLGGIFSLTKSTNGKVADRLRLDTVDAIPDKEVARKQPNLVSDFARGRYSALYYIRFTLSGTKTAGVVKSFSYEDIYSPISGSFLLQKRVPNVAVGESFKRGDILVYNPGFFVKDPMSKQVTFKHGVTGYVAILEKSTNHEDACEISQDISKRLKMSPCHQRQVATTKDAALLKIVKLGDHVETSDSLCVISDEYLVNSSGEVEMDNLDIMEKLSRQTPSAGYTGIISKMRVLYGCNREQLSESLKAVLKVYEKSERDRAKSLATADAASVPDLPGYVEPGTKYKGIDFTDETVVLEFMIQEEIDVVEGDKLCFGLSSKSIVSHVTEEQHYSESGIPIDVLFSGVGIVNRIVSSPFNGLAERNMAKLKENILAMWDA